MEKLKRTIFFWILVLMFVIIAPAVVLYAKGFRFDLSRGVFVHSGTISIKSNPQDIVVSLDGKVNDSKALDKINNSYNVMGLMPKGYNLSIGADGYQTWNKNIEVHSGVASEFWNVLLVRNEYTKIDYNTTGIEKFFISPQSKYIIYTANSASGLSTRILDIKSKEIVGLFDFADWNFITEDRRENIEWTPEEDYLSVPVQKTEDGKTQFAYFIVDPNAKTSFNLNELLNNDDISYVRWDPKDKNYLFYLSNNSLYRVNITNPTDSKQIAQDVSSFDLSKTNVYYSVMPHELVYKNNLDGSGTPNQITSSFPEDITRNFRLIAYDDSRIAFLTQNKDLYLFNQGEYGTYTRKLGYDIEGIQFSDDGKKLLYWTKNAMSVYYLRNWNVSPVRGENTIEDITRYSEEIKNIQWFKDYEHVIFSISSDVKIIELDPMDHRNIMNLPKTNSQMPLIGYNLAQERLYFVDSKDASTSLFSIVLPEPTPILGIYTPPNN
ncbi:MAG: hypothetical protein Q7T51_04940 [Candidatus Moranbacteria bacterium]|nr:hypothetical protein [Candidatus Moranbacteria bacterium]